MSTLLQLVLFIKAQNQRGEKQHQVSQAQSKLQKKLRKVNLHRFHQQVKLHPCIFQVLLQFNRNCMFMIVIMLKLPTQSITPSLKFLSAPPDLTCYCGLAFNTNEELSLHVSSVHKDKVYKCSTCGTQCKNNRATWKHFRSQHLYIHTHHCTIASCQFGKNNTPYGNDDQCLVWMHMGKKHSLKSPLGCPKCTKTFSSPKYQIPHIKNKHDLAPKKKKQNNLAAPNALKDT